MGLFRVLWSIIQNWQYKQFRQAMRQSIGDWQQSQIKKGKVPLPELVRPVQRRRSRTDEFHFSAPENGEKRNKERTGTFMLTEEDLNAELAKKGRSPDRSLQRPE